MHIYKARLYNLNHAWVKKKINKLQQLFFTKLFKILLEKELQVPKSGMRLELLLLFF